MIDQSKINEKIYFDFTYYALKLLGKNLYSNPWTAISEIVANGLDAGAPEIYVLLDISNKRESHIEILDTGSGMTFSDLKDKYVLIGRNKRTSENFVSSDKVFGRKGIGKLAALYLSPVYFLATKTAESNSIWKVDTKKYQDNERPSLDSVPSREFLLDELWKKQGTGTLIELTQVDLSRIGEEKLKSLSSILADYYMLNNISSKIYVAVIDEQHKDIVFNEAKKNTFFDTMYAIWDNAENCVSNNLQEKIYLTKKDSVPEEIDKPRSTIVIDTEFKDIVQGSMLLKNIEGKMVKKNYSLTGWIGIQGSLDNAIQKRNNEDYKKQIFRGNSLRLYSRGKLAVDDVMKYLNNTQAFASYIEGEINFDILEENDLEDISTSNREGYSIADPRVQKLLSIVKDIVNRLIRERVKIGNDINSEIKAYQDKKLREEEEKKNRALIAQQKAEIEAKQEREIRVKAEEEVRIRTNQAYFLQKQINADENIQAYNTHVIKNNAGRISDNILLLLKKHPETKDYREVQSISLASKKILSAVNYFNNANYDFMIKNMNGNLSKFICQYVENVISKEYYNQKIQILGFVDYICNFPPQDVTVAMDNIFSNANKAKSKNVSISFEKNEDSIFIKFINDGSFLPDVDKEKLFEFGYSCQNSDSSAIGTGVGLFQIKDCFERKIAGKVNIYNNDKKGVTLEIKLNENKLQDNLG